MSLKEAVTERKRKERERERRRERAGGKKDIIGPNESACTG